MEVEMQGGDAPSLGVPIHVPPTLSLDALQSILTESGTALTLDQLQAPNANVIIQIYNALLSIPTLREKLTQLEMEKQENERRNVEMDMQLHEAERLKDEAEQRAEENRIAKEDAIKEKSDLSSQLAQAKGILEGLQNSAESGVQQSAEVKGQLEKIQQEKRDVLEILEREKVESARRAEEIDNLTIRARESRSEVSRLLTELQGAKSTEGTALFKIQSLEQELVLKSNDATWAHQELRKTTEELAQSRNQSHNEISTLTLQVQQATQALEASQSKASSLQSAYDTAVLRLEEISRERSELRQRLAEQEGAFASELSTQQRLSDLMEQQKESAERRMAVIEEQWETILDQHREREDVLRAEIVEENRLRESVEKEKQEIQLALDQLAESVGIQTNGNIQHEGSDAGDVADTSNHGFAMNRSFISLSGTPSLMSPTAALASKVQRSGKSFTQVYAELAKTQEELRRERLESHRIGSVLEQVMADLQERGPALVAQREECEQMSHDLREMSTTLAKACEERDQSEREARMNRLKSEASLRENQILNQQVADLGRQVRELSREILLRDDPSAAQRLEDDGSQVDITATSSDTQSIISSELVTFRSLTDLVTQNGRLLRVVRELGSKMEAEEQNYRATLEAGEREAVAEAKELITRLQDEIQNERSRLEGVRRERDMFRSMCAAGGSARGQIQASTSSGSENNSPHIALTNQYSQLQSQFEAFRSETAKDTERLKEDAYQARSEASRNALSAAKEKASRESVEERLANAQQTHQMAKRELEELQRRFSSLQESLTKQEIASHSLSQQLLVANSKEERLRNEVSNLTAEKNLHQQTTERLIEEKKSNSVEKANLSELLRNVQSMQAELERSSGEARRRLESQSERLEEQCKELRSRLSKEEESHRHTSMRREVESTDLKSRLEKANEDLAKTREELAVAKTSVQHLTTKSEELQKQLDSREEKLAVYERRNFGGAEGSGGGRGEVHYVNDQERGVVWEEVIILCPQHISLILLSATVPNTKEFADWVGRTKKRDIYVISTPKRPVPLEHFLYAGKELYKIVDANGRFLNNGVKEAGEAIKRRQEKEREANGQAPQATRGGRGGAAAASNVRGGGGGSRGQRGHANGRGGPALRGRGGGGGGGNFSGGGQSGRGDKSLWIHLVGMLKKKDLLPVVTFVFSKKRCEEYASGMPNTDLCTAREKSEVHIVIEKSLTRLKGTDKDLPQIARMRDLLSRGIGVHHGGLLPIVKEVVEMLFQRGLVKVLFATETFAMGVNMPARSVVFSGIRKHDGHNFRELLAGEYTQMSGRAGRRGLDATGVVIINAADELPETGVLNKMLLGQPTKLQSQFRLTYNMILNLLRVEALKVEEMIKRSFSENASQRLLPDQEKKVKEGEKLLASLPIMPDKERADDLDLYYDLCSSVKRSNLDVLQMALSQQQGSKLFAAGRVVILHDKHFSVFCPAVIVKPVTRDEFLVLAAVTGGRKSGKMDSRWDQIPPQWPPSLQQYPIHEELVYDLREVPLTSIIGLTMHVIKIEQSMIMALRISAMQRTVEQIKPLIQDMAKLESFPEVDWSKIRRIDFQEIIKEREKYQVRVHDFLSQHMYLKAPWMTTFTKEYDMVHHRKLLQMEISRLKMSISDENLELLPDYHQRIEVLKKMRFIDPVSENVLLKGRVACEINSVDELVSTELILDNFWNGFEPEEIVGLLSCLVFKEKAEGEVELQGRLLEGYETIMATAERVSFIQSQFQLNTQDYEVSLKTHMVPVAYQWAKGMPFAEICQMTDIAEGTIVRVITRLDESCRELRDAARVIGDADLWSKMESCMQLIRRDVIFAASLYF